MRMRQAKVDSRQGVDKWYTTWKSSSDDDDYDESTSCKIYVLAWHI